ncbi:unnamed protein product [Meloidogyne enterolobii]|uniref:Uncharacterized protein n=1 Tax=Meloidogyne enterolobii TaxID=390850 RepID=A0ACB1A3M0_MELEN
MDLARAINQTPESRLRPRLFKNLYLQSLSLIFARNPIKIAKKFPPIFPSKM